MRLKTTQKTLAKTRRKRCSACDRIKSFKEFYKYSNGFHSSRCRSCEIQRVSAFNRTVHGNMLHNLAQDSYRYGLSPVESRERKAKGCEICLKLDYELPGGSRLGHDHDHTTGELRGTLCTYDNFLVGLLESGHKLKRTERVQRALGYIDKYDTFVSIEGLVSHKVEILNGLRMSSLS